MAYYYLLVLPYNSIWSARNVWGTGVNGLAQQNGVNKSDKRILNHHKMEVGTELIIWKKQMYIAGGEGKSI